MARETLISKEHEPQDEKDFQCLSDLIDRLQNRNEPTNDDLEFLKTRLGVQLRTGAERDESVQQGAAWELAEALLDEKTDPTTENKRADARKKLEALLTQEWGELKRPSQMPNTPVAWLLRTLQDANQPDEPGGHEWSDPEKEGQSTRSYGAGWMPDHCVTLFTGRGGVGKSRLALQLAVHVARGAQQQQSFLGSQDSSFPTLWTNTDAKGDEIPRSGNVVYACWETREAAFKKRLRAVSTITDEEGNKIESIPESIYYANMKKLGALWGVPKGEHVARAGGWLAAGEWLKSQAERLNADLLILDPLAAAFMQSENDRGLVRAFLSNLDAWCEDNQCAVLLIAHPPKGGDSTYAGSTDWEAGVQCKWFMRPATRKQDVEGKKVDTLHIDDRGTQILRLEVDKLNEDKLPHPLEIKYDWGQYIPAEHSVGKTSSNKRKWKS